MYKVIQVFILFALFLFWIESNVYIKNEIISNAEGMSTSISLLSQF